MAHNWRLIESSRCAAAVNMAVDHALVERVAAGERAVLRCYGWQRPTLSLGRNQEARGRLRADVARDRGIDVVRRPTGGAAVYHDREVTYAVAVPVGLLGSPRETYAAVNRALVAGLRGMGVGAGLAAAGFAFDSAIETSSAGPEPFGAGGVRFTAESAEAGRGTVPGGTAACGGKNTSKRNGGPAPPPRGKRDRGSLSQRGTNFSASGGVEVRDELAPGGAGLRIPPRPPRSRRCKVPASTSPICFGSPIAGEVVAGGRKLVGSAQRRYRRALLQHGSVLLAGGQERVAELIGTGTAPADGAGASGPRNGGRSEAAVATLGELLGRVPPAAEVAAALTAGFEEVLGIRFARADRVPGGNRVAELAERYGSAAWTWRR